MDRVAGPSGRTLTLDTIHDGARRLDCALSWRYSGLLAHTRTRNLTQKGQAVYALPTLEHAS